MKALIYASKKTLSNPSWSSDGNQIAFIEDGIITIINQSGTILATFSNTYFISKPEWSPTCELILAVDFRNVIHAINVSTGEISKIGEGTNPRIANKNILYINKNRLYKTNVIHAPAKQLVDLMYPIKDFDCSPCGTKIIYCKKDLTLMISDIDGTSIHALYPNERLSRHGLHVHFGYTPRWSPNGNYIAYHQVTDLDRILVAEANGSDVYIAGNGLLPTWSLDSKKILFESNDNIIKIADPYGTREIVIEKGESPCWSPDGTSFVFVKGNHELIIYKIS